MIFRAFAGGKEIKDFHIGGKQVQQIWGGDTLLWEKRKREPPPFSIGFITKEDIVISYGTWGGRYDEIGFRIECLASNWNPVEEIEKFGAHIKTVPHGSTQYPFECYSVSIGCKLKRDPPYAKPVLTCRPYWSYMGKEKPLTFSEYDFLSSSGNYIYSWNGTFSYHSRCVELSGVTIHCMVEGIKEIVSKNVTIFSDLNEMRNWLNS